jgi:hypothetical protein
MSIVGSFSTPDIRQRKPSSSSHQHHESSIRVVSCSSSAAALPRSEGSRPYARRKPVILSSSDEEELDVKRANYALKEQINHSTSFTATNGHLMPLSPLLPSPIIDGIDRIDKAEWSDLPLEEEERDVADASLTESTIINEGSSGHRLSHTSQTQEKEDPALFSPMRAAVTLESIGRSLQWTQKLPQGRHLSRAKSRTTLRSTDNITAITSDDGKGTKDTLAEARAGLRLLAKRREDVLEDEEEATPYRAATWNYFKWTLFLSVLVVFAYGTLGFIASLLTWAGAWDGAEVSATVDTDLVIREFSVVLERRFNS